MQPSRTPSFSYSKVASRGRLPTRASSGEGQSLPAPLSCAVETQGETPYVVGRGITCHPKSNSRMNVEQDYAIPIHSRVDTVALYWISRFGWLRSRELGGLMWPNTTSVLGETLPDDAKEDATVDGESGRSSTTRARLGLVETAPKGRGTANVLFVCRRQIPATPQHPRATGRQVGSIFERHGPLLRLGNTS